MNILAESVERRAVDSLTPYPRNAKKHPAKQVEQIAASIREFGFTIPVLIGEDGGIIAGHGRVAAAQSMGLTEVPVIVARGWSEEQRRAYVIADNKLTENGVWDIDLLRVEFLDLHAANFDLGLIGFKQSDVQNLLFGDVDPHADEAPPLPDIATTRPGDMWLLDEHRLICGDATDPSVVLQLFGGDAPTLMVTDPPYGVNYDPSWRNEAGISINGTVQRITTGSVRKSLGGRALGKTKNDDRFDWGEAWQLFPGNVAYVWHGSNFTGQVQASLDAADFGMRSQIIWAKTRMIISRADYHWQHETCWYAVRKGKPSRWAGDRSQTTLWTIEHIKSETGHGAQKPVECMRRPVLNNSRAGECVYDPFVGSGTSIIAAQLTERRCLAVDIDPLYCDVAVQRWEEFTGKRAELVKGPAH